MTAIISRLTALVYDMDDMTAALDIIIVNYDRYFVNAKDRQVLRRDPSGWYIGITEDTKKLEFVVEKFIQAKL